MALWKADKKKGWNTVKSLLKGDVASVAAEKALNVAEGALVEAGKAMGIKNYPLANPSGYFPVTPVEEDFSKAAVKAAKKNKDKVKSLVYATVEFSIQPLPEVGVPTKAYCLTNIYITDEKGKLVIEIVSKTLKSTEYSPLH